MLSGVYKRNDDSHTLHFLCIFKCAHHHLLRTRKPHCLYDFQGNLPTYLPTYLPTTYLPTTYASTMLPFLFALLLLPPLCFAAPPNPPTITRLVFSGSGCPNTSNSVRADTAVLGDAVGMSFSQLKGSSTDNCAVHLQAAGASAGWQVGIREVAYTGHVVLRGRSALDTFTQVFWSESAGDTVWFFFSFPPNERNILFVVFVLTLGAVADVRCFVHVGRVDGWVDVRGARDERLCHCEE